MKIIQVNGSMNINELKKEEDGIGELIIPAGISMKRKNCSGLNMRFAPPIALSPFPGRENDRTDQGNSWTVFWKSCLLSGISISSNGRFPS